MYSAFRLFAILTALVAGATVHAASANHLCNGGASAKISFGEETPQRTRTFLYESLTDLYTDMPDERTWLFPMRNGTVRGTQFFRMNQVKDGFIVEPLIVCDSMTPVAAAEQRGLVEELIVRLNHHAASASMRVGVELLLKPGT